MTPLGKRHLLGTKAPGRMRKLKKLDAGERRRQSHISCRFRTLEFASKTDISVSVPSKLKQCNKKLRTDRIVTLQGEAIIEPWERASRVPAGR